jgi:hypothetical protein
VKKLLFAAVLVAGILATQTDRFRIVSPNVRPASEEIPARTTMTRTMSASPAATMAASSVPEKGAPPLEVAAANLVPGANDDPGPGAEYIARYDGRSGRLSPSAQPSGGDVTTKVTSTGPAPHLTIWVPTIRVQAGAEVVIHATLTDDDGAPVQPDSIVAVIARHGEPPGAELPLHAAEGELQLRLRAPPQAGIFDYVVRARGDLQGESYDRAAAGTFLVNAAGGRIDAAAARVEKRGGDLALTVPADLDRPGTYWMYAELWGGVDGTRPIAFARERFERLPSGARTLSISFGGAIIRDTGVDGPYVVRNLRFQQVNAFPPQEQEPIWSLPPTLAFRADDFN